MKIMYLLFSFTTGGTERLVADICNEMVTREHQVHLYVVNDLCTQSMLDTLDGRVRVRLQKRAPGGGDKGKTLLAVSRYIRENRIDVVHCNSLDAPELLALKPIAFPWTRVIFTVHNMTGYPSLSRGKVIYRNLLCHRLIAISESVKREMLRCGANSRKLVTVYNAIDLARFPGPAAKRFDPDCPVIGNVARIDSRTKGQDVLIRAAAILKERYPRLRCLFAGAADKAHEKDLERLRQLVKDNGLEENVYFLGNVEDIPSFLREVDIFALPSRSEGFGISLIEAMAMGIPCVASDLDGPAEILEGGRWGALFACGDARELAEKLDAVLRDIPGSRERAREAADIRISSFDIRKMCDRLETVMA